MYRLSVGKAGTFSKEGIVKTSPDDVDRFLEDLRNNRPPKLAIHFHGGLVSEANGDKTATVMKHEFERAEAVPLSFVWETDFATTVRDNLESINRTKLFKNLLHKTFKVVISRMALPGAKGGAGEWTSDEIEEERKREGQPFSELDAAFLADNPKAKSLSGGDLGQLEQQVEAELRQRYGADREIAGLLEKEAPTTKLLNPEFRQTGAGKKGLFSWVKLVKHLAKVVVRVIRRLLTKRDHGIYPTIVEEILREFYLDNFGAWVWGGMKNKARDMFASNQNLPRAELKAGTYLLDGLAKVQAETNLKIYLSGHSAGAIAVRELLKSLGPNTAMRFAGIQLLAPALRHDQFHQIFIDQNGRSPAVGDLRIFTMDEQSEIADRLFNPLYTRSLLYFISGVLEPDEVDMPLLGMQRYHKGQPPFDAPWFKETNIKIKQSTVYSPSAPDAPHGERTEALTHGGFDNDPATLESLRHWIGL